MSTIPTNPIVEWMVDGEWVDITADCRLDSADSGGGIVIKRGRSNEAPSVEPTELDFTLNNGASKVASTLGQVGIYSERNPNSPYWGKVGRNQPVRVSAQRVTDPFTRSFSDGWGVTPDWTDSLNRTRTGETWNHTGNIWNFDCSGSAATIQSTSSYQAATMGTFADADVLTRLRVDNRTSEVGIVFHQQNPVVAGQVDASFEANTVSQWSTTGCTLVQTTAQAKHGVGSALMTASGVGTDVYVQPTSANLVAITEGVSYKVRSFARLAVTGNWRLALHWYNSSKVLLSSSFSGNFGGTGGSWTSAELTVTAPAGAAYVGYGPVFAASPSAGTAMHVDDIQLLQTSGLDRYVALINMAGATDQLRIVRYSASSTIFTPHDLPANVVANTDYWLQAQIAGQRVRARLWQDGSEPPEWQIHVFHDQEPYEASVPMVGQVGLFTQGGTAIATFDSIQVDVWRAYAEITRLPPRWDLSRTDFWVPVRARGILQRLGQGRKALDSALTLHLQAYTPTYAWLRLEAGAESGSVSNAAPDGLAGGCGGLTFTAPDLTGAHALPGVAGYAHLGEDTSYVTVQIPFHNSGSAWTILCFWRVPANPVGNDILLYRVSSTGTARTWAVYLQMDGAVRVEARAVDNTLLGSAVAAMYGGASPIPVGSWIAAALYVFNDGSNVDWAWNYHQPGSDFGFLTANGTFAGNVGRATQFHAGSSATHTTAGGTSLTQVFHYVGDLPFVDANFARAAAAYDGETALVRFLRLLADAGVSASQTMPSSVSTEAMGPQLPAKRLELLEQCAVATGGLIMEDRDSHNTLSFVGRQAMYNPETVELDIDAGHLSPPLEPTPDDQGTRNDVTVVQSLTGLFAVSVQQTGPLNVNPPESDPDGVGVYDEAPELNLGDVDDLQPAANWRRAQGTQPDPRYPGMTADLTSTAYSTDDEMAALVLGLDSGRAIQITNPEVTPDSHVQLVQAYEEKIDQFDWDITFTTTPGTVNANIGVVEANARIGPSNSITEASFVSGTDTALSVEVGDADADLWVTTATDPDVTGFDIMVDGVQLRVVSISGSSDPQTITVEQTPVNGVIKTIAVGSKVELADWWTVAW